MNGRLIVEEFATPEMAMAVDEALAESAARPSYCSPSGHCYRSPAAHCYCSPSARPAQPALRVYRWSRSAVSLGALQAADEVVDRAEALRQGVPVVRRRTGGGAILHGGDISFSLTAPADSPLIPYGTVDRQAVVASAVRRALISLGLEVEIHQAPPGPPYQTSSPLCFDDFSGHEPIVAGGKLAGGAQRRFRRALLHQGTILIHSLELPGLLRRRQASRAMPLANLMTRPPGLCRLAEALALGFSATFGIAWQQDELTADEISRAVDLARTRYTDAGWNWEGRYRVSAPPAPVRGTHRPIVAASTAPDADHTVPRSIPVPPG